MLIKPKYEYATLSRFNEDGKRFYTTPDGRHLPSVTTILSKTMPQDKVDGLNAWRDAVGHDKAKQITTEAAGVGTAMHAMLEEHILGTTKPGRNNLVYKIATPMAQNIIDNGLCNFSEIWGTEISLFYPEIYAGSTDFAGVWKGKEAIGDFKQSNKLKTSDHVEDYRIQLVFYGTAHNRLYGTNIRTGVVLISTRKCEYQEFVIDGDEWDHYERIMWDRVETFYKLA